MVCYLAYKPSDINHTTYTEVVRSFDSGESKEGCILGCDFVGKVEAIGNSVSRLQPGDIISGLICGGKCYYQIKEDGGLCGSSKAN
jgi:NADPH:quinone reductase-like Zn-dependent oxidoreductase